MISKDKEYRTRDGRLVRIYATDAGKMVPVHGAVLYDGKWEIRSWMLDGQAFASFASSDDLIEVKPRLKRTVWLNVYADGRRVFAHLDQSLAITNRGPACAACVKVEIDCEEGEGLND